MRLPSSARLGRRALLMSGPAIDPTRWPRTRAGLEGRITPTGSLNYEDPLNQESATPATAAGNIECVVTPTATSWQLVAWRSSTM